MAINDPYVPGDPYSYDLKWMVRKLKEYRNAADAAAAAQNRADDAYDLADDANTAAIAAQDRADDAYDIAGDANTAAIAAQGTADDANIKTYHAIVSGNACTIQGTDTFDEIFAAAENKRAIFTVWDIDLDGAGEVPAPAFATVLGGPGNKQLIVRWLTGEPNEVPRSAPTNIIYRRAWFNNSKTGSYYCSEITATPI